LEALSTSEKIRGSKQGPTPFVPIYLASWLQTLKSEKCGCTEMEKRDRDILEKRERCISRLVETYN
jgi:hypothetical protein